MGQNVQSTPYESPVGFHRHKCDNCGQIWEHSNSCAGNEHAHTCTTCGHKNWERYKGPDAPIMTIEDKGNKSCKPWFFSFFDDLM